MTGNTGYGLLSSPAVWGTCCTSPGLRAMSVVFIPVCQSVTSVVIQEADDQLITGYNKSIIGFQKLEFHNLNAN